MRQIWRLRGLCALTFVLQALALAQLHIVDALHNSRLGTNLRRCYSAHVTSVVKHRANGSYMQQRVCGDSPAMSNGLARSGAVPQSVTCNPAFVPTIGMDADGLYGRRPKANRIQRNRLAPWHMAVSKTPISSDDELRRDNSGNGLYDHSSGRDNDSGGRGAIGDNTESSIHGNISSKRRIGERSESLNDENFIPPIIKSCGGKMKTPPAADSNSKNSKTAKGIRPASSEGKSITPKNVTGMRSSVAHVDRGLNDTRDLVDGQNVNNSDEEGDTAAYVRKEGTSISEEVAKYEDLYTTMESWGQSTKKGDRDIYRFLKRRLKDVQQSAEVQYAEDGDGMTVDDFLEAIDGLGYEIEDHPDIPYKWHRYLEIIRLGYDEKIRAARRSKKLTATDVIDKCLRQLKREEPGGYRYPIAGTPDENYSDPNVYKAWGRTGLYHTQYMKKPGTTSGEVETRNDTLEELILSNSPLKDMDEIEKQLEDLRHKRLEKEIGEIENVKAETSIDSLPEVAGNISTTDSTATATESNECSTIASKVDADVEMKSESDIRQESTAAADGHSIGSDGTQAMPSITAPTFTATVDGEYKLVDAEFLKSERQRQLELLLSLNPYNPWDEYRRITRVKSGLKIKDPIQVKYKLNTVELKVKFESSDNYDVDTGDSSADSVLSRESMGGMADNIPSMGDTLQRDSRDEKIEDVVAERNQSHKGQTNHVQLPPNFLQDYLHYFLMLPEDHQMLQEFEKAEYLYDVLRYFDPFDREEPKPEPEIPDAHDRLFSIIFPGWEGFPKPPPDPVYPMTLTPDKAPETYRVNAINAMVALLKARQLSLTPTADMLQEQRVRAILTSIERSLELEIKRIKLGLVDIEVPGIDAQLCKVDDAYLATLSATLAFWNIRDGIETIVDEIVVLTTANMSQMRPKYLIAIAVNLSNLHKLPKSVFLKFVKAVTQHVQQQMAADLVKSAVDVDHIKCMDFDTAAQMLNLLARYPGALGRDFMVAFMQLYRRDIMQLKVPEYNCNKDVILNSDVHESESGAASAEGFIAQNNKGESGTRPGCTKSSDCSSNPNRPFDINVTSNNNNNGVALVVGPQYWEYLRQATDDEMATVHRKQDESAQQLKRELNVRGMRGRFVQHVWSLISCLSWCDLIKEYKNVVDMFNMTSLLQDFELSSVGALAVLQTCSQQTDKERTLIAKALSALRDVRSMISDETWLEAMEIYSDATNTGRDGAEPRIKPDRAFISAMMNRFVDHRQPSWKILRRAVDLLHGFSNALSKNQRQELFQQMCESVCDYAHLQLQALNAERLDYPLREMAHVLRVSAACGVRIDKVWKIFLDLLKVFKHTLSVEDIKETLLALKAANYTSLSEMGELLIRRMCDIVEVMPYTAPEDVCEIMEIGLSIKINPTKLLRWFLYLSFHEVPERDMDRLAMDMVGEKLDYEVDFRGWKRPVGQGTPGERLRLFNNLFTPYKMHGSKAYYPSDELKYVMQQSIRDPPPYSAEIKPKPGIKLPRQLGDRIKVIVQQMIYSGYECSQADVELFKLAGVMPQKAENGQTSANSCIDVIGLQHYKDSDTDY
ncbi:M48 family peptidase, putative [Babesia ovata]|uniref:M48 family peptidase, putative n=1 Tax=Babesia ovata TaxID=189622 RepID=A0A2H6K8K2_9APIC|nr:M48 family peptidase, putative [Babesia ovata]GBE59321.1 M48 family peptidase, putative [Babesia ovata]